MIAVKSTLPILDLDTIAAHYEFQELQIVRVLPGGMFASPTLVESDRGRFVLRMHRFRGTVDSFRFQAEAIESAARKGVGCARVESTRDGEWCIPIPGSNAVLAAHEFAEGRCDDWIEWNSRQRDGSGFLYGLGQEVAKLHDVLATSHPAGDSHLRLELPPIQLLHVAEVRSEWRNSLRALHRQSNAPAPNSRDRLLSLESRIEGHWEALAARLDRWKIQDVARQVVHGDISPVNIVYGDIGEPYFIDWDCVHIGHRVYDALGDVLNRRPDDPRFENRFCIDEVREYLAGYASQTTMPLSESERNLVPAFCLARQLEDLRQRLFALPSLDAELDETYARLIGMRVEMMDQIELN